VSLQAAFEAGNFHFAGSKEKKARNDENYASQKVRQRKDGTKAHFMSWNDKLVMRHQQ